ncbi:MAG: T9SS type A sorting domain-containing protein [Bacteroidetes bacterium]|nr:T9SS type A sorting domain-containing protein [Bacteroidota bacterium]
MKIILQCFLFLPVFSFCQLSFDSLRLPNYGANRDFYVCDENTPTLALVTGNNAIWDFSNAQGTGSRKLATMTTPNMGPYGAEYSTYSNKAMVIENFMTSYYHSTQNVNRQSGFVIPNTDLGNIKAKFFLNSWEQMVFPFSHSMLQKDDYSGSISFLLNGNPQNPACYGSGLVSYDGFGELRLPNGDTLKNISRLKIIDTLFTSVQLFGSVKLIREQFEYYNLDSLGAMPLMITAHAFVLSSFPDPLIDVKMILTSRKPLATVGLNNIGRLLDRIEIYPNPSNGNVQISGFTENLNFEIYNALGLLVTKGVAEKNNRWNLEPGVYQLVLKSTSDHISKKIVVQ